MCMRGVRFFANVVFEVDVGVPLRVVGLRSFKP